MRAHMHRRRHPWRRASVGLTALVAGGSLGMAVTAATGAAGPPAACHDNPQITDASGDGHHATTDVLAAWFSEAGGRLQAVVQVRAGTWVAEHEDPEIPGSGFAVLFTVAGQTRFVRANAPGPDHPGDPVTYDHGTYNRAGGFVSAGATTGSTITATSGTVTIDVPAATGAVAGATLANPFVLTYDGITGGAPDWVDHAPGGTSPDDPSRGADYVVGSCTVAPPATGTDTTPTTTTPVDTTPQATNAVQLTARSKVVGGGTITVSGRVLPARAGIPVTLTRRAHRTARTTLTTRADGTFTAKVPIQETTELRASAEGIGSQTRTVTAFTTVKVKVVRKRDGSAVVTGTVRPKLPGRVLWLRGDAISPSARTTTRAGAFRLRLAHPRRGRYQAVVIPTGDRAERATSNTGVIR